MVTRRGSGRPTNAILAAAAQSPAGSRTPRFEASDLAADVMLHLIDGAGLVFDDGREQVSQGQHANHVVVADHGQVPNVMLAHE